MSVHLEEPGDVPKVDYLFLLWHELCDLKQLVHLDG
jgi:hypothetical protein